MHQDPPHLDPHGTDPLPSIFCKSFSNTKEKQWWVLLKHPRAHTWGSGPISPSAWGWDVCGSRFPASLTSWDPKGLGQKIQPPTQNSRPGLLPAGPFAHTQQNCRGCVKLKPSGRAWGGFSSPEAQSTGPAQSHQCQKTTLHWGWHSPVYLLHIFMRGRKGLAPMWGHPEERSAPLGEGLQNHWSQRVQENTPSPAETSPILSPPQG